MKVIYLEETHVIIGAQLLCARATDMISEFAVAIAQKLTLEEMASVIRPHPSFSEIGSFIVYKKAWKGLCILWQQKL